MTRFEIIAIEKNGAGTCEVNTLSEVNDWVKQHRKDSNIVEIFAIDRKTDNCIFHAKYNH